MAFKHNFLKPVDDLIRVDEPGKERVYVRGDKTYRSVTSVLSRLDSEWLAAWKARVGEERAAHISRVATDKGTAIHSLCENYLKNEELPKTMPLYLEEFLKARRLLDKYVGEVRGIEHQLYSNELLAAGTTDLIAQWGEEPLDRRPLAIIDFKTSKKAPNADKLRKYFLQLGTYSHMVQELYNLHVPRLVIVSLQADSIMPVHYTVNGAGYVAKARQMFKSTIPE